MNIPQEALDATYQHGTQRSSPMKVQPGDLPSSDVSSIVGPTHSRSASLVSSFELVYDLAPSAPLPAIDISRSVRSVLLSERLNKRWTRLMGKTQVGIFFIYNTALVLNLVIICTNHWVVRWTAITNQVIMYYAILAQISLMRVDILQLLLYTYEFWFITVVNCISTVIMTFYVPDLRGLTVWGMWIGNELVAIIDAQIVFQRGLMLSAIPPVAFTAGVVCCVQFNSMEGANNFALFRVNGYELDAADVLINGYSNMLILMLRNLYRRREAMKEHGQNSSVIQCITYRCPVRLRIRRHQVGSSGLIIRESKKTIGASSERTTASFIASARTIQMECYPVRLKQSAKLLLVPFVQRIFNDPDEKHSKSWQIVASTTMSVGIILTVLSCIPVTAVTCRLSGFVVTLVFFMACVSTYYRQLLQHLVISYDFAFLSIQFTAIHLCLCDSVNWDSRILTVVSSWLWIHWVLTFDCMPTVIKGAWGLHHHRVVWIAVLIVLAHVLLACVITFGHTTALRDRAWLSVHVLGVHFRLHVLPTMLSRMLVTFGWSCRIAWRFWWRHDDEMVIIQGKVTYMNNRKRMKHVEKEVERLNSKE